MSTERLLLGFVHAAADAGAGVANHAEALELLRGPRGRVAGVALRDALGGSTLELRARLVVERRRAVGGRARRAQRPAPFPAAAPARPQPRPAPAVLRSARGRGAQRRPLPVPGAVAGPLDRRNLLRAGGRAAQRPAGVPRRGGAGVSLGGPRALLTSRWSTRASCPGRAALTACGPARASSTTSARTGSRGSSAFRASSTRRRGPWPSARSTSRCGASGGLPSRCRTAETRLAKARRLAGPLDDRARVAVREEMALSLGDAVLRRLDLGTAGPPAAADLAVVGAGDGAGARLGRGTRARPSRRRSPRSSRAAPARAAC